MAPPHRVPSRRSALLLVALAALAAGCQDYATAPTLPSAVIHGSAAGTGGAAEITPPYTCFISIATPGGQYRHDRLQLTFTKEVLARDGSTMHYRYRGYADGAELDRQADCTIPRNAAAVAMMHRIFRVHDKQMRKAGETSDVGVSILSTDIDGIVITACQYGGEYPNCDPKPIGYQEDPNPPVTECSTYCDPWSDDGGGGTGGDDSSACPATYPNCLQDLTPTDRQTIDAALAKVRTQFTDPKAGEVCPALKYKFLELYDANPSRIKRGNVAIPDAGLGHGAQWDGTYIHIDGDMLDKAATGDSTYQALLAEIALHEAAHAANYPDHATDGSETMGNYTTYPYNYASRGPGVTESCVP